MADFYTVSQINHYIGNLFARDFVLNRITVRGEVSNCKYHSSGHVYFTLKDAGGAISCVLFARERQELNFRLQDGQQVDASGQISVYEKSGSYQLYVRRCTPAGSGQLYERFLQLRKDLEEMGMFDSIYKKPVPPYCQKIGIVTALTGAAIRDMINVSKRRNPYVELVLCPAKVQGEGAAESIVQGIRRLDKMGLDVLIVGRGGGSIEDLWAFNEEIVAKAIFEAETPIISAVGHETDFTIADFVADLRAPTPSAAAELANFEYEVFAEELDSLKNSLRRTAEHKLMLARARLNAGQERLKRLSPESVLEHKKQILKEGLLRMQHALQVKSERADARNKTYRDRLSGAMKEKQIRTTKHLELLAARLDERSPLKKISGGYGYIEDAGGRAVLSAGSVSKGSRIRVYVRDGRIDGTVTSSEKMNYEQK